MANRKHVEYKCRLSSDSKVEHLKHNMQFVYQIMFEHEFKKYTPEQQAYIAEELRKMGLLRE